LTSKIDNKLPFFNVNAWVISESLLQGLPKKAVKGDKVVLLFDDEAKRFGGQRALSSNFLHSLEFGQPILLSRFISSPKELKIKTGKTEIFGYFTLDEISHNLPENKRE
jgi:hypothetical protein